MAFMSLSFRQVTLSWPPDGKGKKYFCLGHGRMVEMHKQGRAIAAEVGRSKTVILNFLKDPESYGTKRSSGRPKKRSVKHAGWSKRATLFSWKKYFIRRVLWTAALFCRKTQSLPHRRGPSVKRDACCNMFTCQPSFDTPVQPKDPFFYWRKKYPRSWCSLLLCAA